MPSPDYLVWLEPASGGRVPIAAGLEFGRSEECEVHINSPKASRHHAAIHIQKHAWGNECLLIDLGSANGTYVNDQRIVRQTQLQDGDRIRIADQEFRFHIRTAAGENDDLRSAVSTVKEVRAAAGWLLVCDIVDSTPLVRQLPVDELTTLITRWLRACTLIIEEGAGNVTELRGDGFLAYWSDAGRACDLVTSTLLQLRHRQATPESRLVLHHGEFTVTTDSAQGGERLIGPAVYFAFRAEKIAATVQTRLLVTEAAKAALGERLPLIPIPGEYELKGFDGMHSFFTLED
jgi:adenylate cyclase